MILLSCLNLLNLSLYCIVVSRCVNITDNAESNREAVIVAHQGKLQLQCIVLAVSIVNKDIFLCDTVLANLYDLQPEAILNKTELAILTENQRFAMLYVDSILCTTSLIINRLVCSVVEDNAVLKNLANCCALVVVSSLQDVDCCSSICGNGASKEMTACTKAKLSWAEWILNSSVRR